MPNAGVPGLRPKKKAEPSKRLKQLHWIKVAERKVATTIWEAMRDEELDIEKDIIEDLFAAKVTAKVIASSNDDSVEGDGADGGVSENGTQENTFFNRYQT